MLQERGVQPVHLTVRTVEGPGNQLAGVNSGYASLPRDGRARRAAAATARSSRRRAGQRHGPAGRASARAGHGVPRPAAEPIDSIRDPAADGARRPASRGARQRRRRPAADDAAAPPDRDRQPAGRARPGEPARPPPGVGAAAPARRRASGYAASRYAGSGSVSGAERGRSRRAAASAATRRAAPRRWATAAAAAARYGDGLTGLMAVNLIRAHREELIQASTGKLDHMVIDVVGSLFDQILSDSRVPPQMARQIARLQLPVLRVALSDSTLLLDPAPSGAPLHQPHRLARLRLRRLRRRPGRAVPDPRAQAGRTRSSKATSTRSSSTPPSSPSSRASSPSRPRARSSRPARRRRSTHKESELRVQQRYMLQLQARARAAGAAGLPAGVPGPGLEPGAGARGAPRRRRLGPRASATAASAATW